MKKGSHHWLFGAAFLALGLLFSQNAAAQFAEPEAAPAPSPALEPELPSGAASINLALTGAAVTGVWYGGALGASLIWPDAPWSPEMKIPFAGPWLSLNQLQCGNELNCTTALEVVRYILVIVDGVGQATGVAFALEALFLPKAAPPKPRAKSAQARLRPFPLVTGDAVGIGLAGEM